MDIEMINKFLKVAITTVVLSVSSYASKASQILLIGLEPSNTTYEWSATCYDCKEGNAINIRPDDQTLWQGVTGSITLKDYTLGDAITGTNLISFAYTGVSQFLPMFTIGTGEGFGFRAADVDGTLNAYGELTLELSAERYAAPIMESYDYFDFLEISITPEDWSFSEDVPMDIGTQLRVMGLPPVIPANKVSAPATLAIFALGLMGLGLRRIKKQS
jgi:hypothetical protein